MAKHIPLRMCAACRRMLPQQELIRIVNDSGQIQLDNDKKLFGRGAYLCRTEECVKKAEKKNILARHFKCNVDTAIYSEAKNYCE